MVSHAAAAFGLFSALLVGCGPPPPPAFVDTGLIRSGVPHAMSLSTSGASPTLFARDGFAARITKRDLAQGYEYSFDLEVRDPTARVWRGACHLRWEIHRGLYHLGEPGFTDLTCGAWTGPGNVTPEYGEVSLALRSKGIDARALKDWDGRSRGHPPQARGPDSDRDTLDLEVRGNGAVFTVDAGGRTVALLQVSPEPGMWVAPGVGDAITTPALFFIEAALVLTRAAFPPQPPAALVDR